MPNILTEFGRAFTIDYARQRQALREQHLDETPGGYKGSELFPSVTVNELSFDYWKDAHLLPVMANVQAFGAEAQIASRDGLEKITGEIPTIKRKINLAGRALIALRREGIGDEDIVRNTLFNDLDNMIDSVLARAEKMRIDAATSGKVQLAENGVVMTIDYGVPDTHQQILSGDSLWSAHATATPIQDMQRWRDRIIDDTGIPVTRAWTSSKVVAHLLQSKEVRLLVHGDTGGTRAASLSQLNAVLEAMDLPLITTYDARVRAQAANGSYSTVRFWPEGKFVMLPDGKLGDTLLGPTEEAMLDVEVDARELAGAYAIVYQEAEPPMVWTKAAITAIPTFPAADAVFQADVL